MSDESRHDYVAINWEFKRYEADKNGYSVSVRDGASVQHIIDKDNFSSIFASISDRLKADLTRFISPSTGIGSPYSIRDHEVVYSFNCPHCGHNNSIVTNPIDPISRNITCISCEREFELHIEHGPFFDDEVLDD